MTKFNMTVTNPSLERDWELNYKQDQQRANAEGKFYIERIVREDSDGDGVGVDSLDRLEVASQEIQNRADALYERFRGWMNLKMAADHALDSEKKLSDFVKAEILPVRDKYYLEHSDEIDEDMEFWQKAGFPLSNMV
jgi:hypothetical protein